MLFWKQYVVSHTGGTLTAANSQIGGETSVAILNWHPGVQGGDLGAKKMRKKNTNFAWYVCLRVSLSFGTRIVETWLGMFSLGFFFLF